jgi:hypothetical protein
VSSLSEVLERGQRVRLLSGEKGNIIGKNENFEFPLYRFHITAVKRLTTGITKMELSYFLHENGI